jgi:hypothetical protein
MPGVLLVRKEKKLALYSTDIMYQSTCLEFSVRHVIDIYLFIYYRYH